MTFTDSPFTRMTYIPAGTPIALMSFFIVALVVDRLPTFTPDVVYTVPSKRSLAERWEIPEETTTFNVPVA